MNSVANLPASERKELFQETAARKGINPAIIEKDFWVCWVLKQLFSDPELQPHLVFKGGTSLSKVFNLIDRFSEDIDLILDWRLLGYGSGQQNPYEDQPSRTQLHRFCDVFNQRAAEYISNTLCPRLSHTFRSCLEVAASVASDDSQVVNIRFPETLSEDYLRPEIRLEIGPLASWVPSDRYIIRPYAAEAFPDVFETSGCPVVAIKAERTFWEKATILHQQAHRPNAIPSRYSRHYYDMYKLAQSEAKTEALANLELLHDVVTFKEHFYSSPWARYDLAKPGSFRLIPHERHANEIRRDYRAMEMMIFGDCPDFDAIMKTLQDLEDEINQLP